MDNGYDRKPGCFLGAYKASAVPPFKTVHPPPPHNWLPSAHNPKSSFVRGFSFSFLSSVASRTYIDREIHLEPVAMSQSLTAPPSPPSRMLFYHPRTSQKQLSITLFLNTVATNTYCGPTPPPAPRISRLPTPDIPDAPEGMFSYFDFDPQRS